MVWSTHKMRHFLTPTEAEQEMMGKLACKREELRVYLREDLPTRLHFSNNRRIEDIVLDLDPGYVTTVSSNFSLQGNHGYDYYYHEMDVSLSSLICLGQHGMAYF